MRFVPAMGYEYLRSPIYGHSQNGQKTHQLTNNKKLK